jgi:hypothetical protein
VRRISVGVFVLCLMAASAGAQPSNDFHWAGEVARGKTIEIRGINGRIHALPASGDRVEVDAVKHARRSSLETVTVRMVQQDGNVTICAVYPASPHRDRRRRDDRSRVPDECRPGADGQTRADNNDVIVDFTVHVPVSVRLHAVTVNGRIDAANLRSDADIETVNGRIDLSTTGTASARTVNGSIDASIGTATGAVPLEFRAVNGSITLKMPKAIDATVQAQVANGRVESEFPLTVQSIRGRNKRIAGTIGRGGTNLDLQTVNGSIHLQLVTP